MSAFVHVVMVGYPASRDVHVRACLDRSEDRAWWDSADVLFCERVISAACVVRRLRDHPGCAVCVGASGGGRLTLAVRCGMRILTLQARMSSELGANQCALIGSAVHALLVLGFAPESLCALTFPDGQQVSFVAMADAQRSFDRPSPLGSGVS